MKPLLTVNWTNLAVATFEADPQLLTPYLPYKTELNDWRGYNYLSLVGFQFSHPVIAGIPSPFYRSFDEVNLRFYIKYKRDNEWRKGVVFIKEIAPSPLVGLAAKLLYKENFISLPLRHHYSTYSDQKHTEYYWKIKDHWNHLKIVTATSPEEPSADSLESFIRDHYYACTWYNPKKTKEFEIQHRPWNIYPGISCDLLLDTQKIYGESFVSCLQQQFASFFVMDGSVTKVSYPSLL